MTRTARKEKKKYEDASTWSEMSSKSVKKKSALKSNEVDDKRLKRREDRRKRRAKSKVCFKCRQSGHRLQDCPNESHDAICFKCGSTEHNIKECTAKVLPGSFPFAQCFICKETGHLSSSCPDNPKGLYPNGGGCKVCGSVEHLKANCPTKRKQTSKSFHVQISTNATSADSDIYDSKIISKHSKNKDQKKHKVIKF